MSEPFIGEIRLFAGNFAPQGWALCQGQLLPIQQNTALFSILGTTYGGNGSTNFALPDLRDRAPVHHGQGTGLDNLELGETPGTGHTAAVVTSVNPARGTGTGSTSTPHNVYPVQQLPTLTMNYIIALQGIFPPRS